MRQLDNAESLDSDSDADIVVSRPEESNNADKFYRIPTEDFEALSTEVRSMHVAAHIGSKNSVLPSLTNSYGTTQRPSRKLDILGAVLQVLEIFNRPV